MSRVVSFRASEELDEFLEQEAERRMTTKSTVANMLIAERVRELQEEAGTGDSVTEEDGDEKGEEMGDSDSEPAALQRHSEKWYVPDSQKGYKYAVKMPTGRRKYYKTAEQAAKRLKKEYE